MVYVIKANGERAKFDREKILRTCERSGVPKDVAERIVSEVEQNVREGTTTKDILTWVLAKLNKYEQAHSKKYELKQALAALEPGEHEFEKYISHLFRAHGYETEWNKIVQGECIEHQMDVIVEKDGKKYLVECKHHVNPHRFCDLGTVIQTWARFDDINKGPNKGVYDNIMLVTNTKFSEHGTRYAKAKGTLLVGWNYPPDGDLRSMIDDKSIYPLTILNIEKKVHEKLSKAGILLIEELAESDIGELYGKTEVSRKVLEKLQGKARAMLA
ncbi:MAG: restriction endonuclease [archaeon]